MYCTANRPETKVKLLNYELLIVIPDRVSSPHPNPLGNGTVLFHLFGKLLLDFERLLRRL